MSEKMVTKASAEAVRRIAVLVALPEGEGEVAGEPAREGGPPRSRRVGSARVTVVGSPGLTTARTLRERQVGGVPTSALRRWRPAVRAGSSPWLRKTRCGVP